MNSTRARTRNRRSRFPELPAAVLVLAWLCALVVILPFAGMAAKVPWGSFFEVLATPEALTALELSVRTALIAIVLDLVLGIPMALALARDWRGVRLLRVLVTMPMALPPVVAGIALLATFGRKGIVGQYLEAFGVSIAFSTIAVVIAQVFVSLPFLVVTVEAALRARPAGYEEVAESLGARPGMVLRRITLPLVFPGISRGTALALARCLGEFGATITFAGSLAGVTRTMPSQIYLARETDSETALVLGVVLILVALVITGATEVAERWRKSRTSDLLPTTPEPSDVSDLDFVEPCGVPACIAGRVDERGWDMDVTIPASIMTTVVGPNGAGKSTLAHVLAGRLALDSGVVTIGDKDVDSDDTFVPARLRGIGYLGQRPMVFPMMSALDNVMFPLRCRGVRVSEAREIARAWMKCIGCAHVARNPGWRLSGGEAAKVAMARALVFDPNLVILDEPTAALDPVATAQFHELMQSGAMRGRTVLWVTHNETEAAMGERTVAIVDGSLSEVRINAGL